MPAGSTGGGSEGTSGDGGSVPATTNLTVSEGAPGHDAATVSSTTPGASVQHTYPGTTTPVAVTLDVAGATQLGSANWAFFQNGTVIVAQYGATLPPASNFSFTHAGSAAGAGYAIAVTSSQSYGTGFTFVIHDSDGHYYSADFDVVAPGTPTTTIVSEGAPGSGSDSAHAPLVGVASSDAAPGTLAASRPGAALLISQNSPGRDAASKTTITPLLAYDAAKPRDAAPAPTAQTAVAESAPGSDAIARILAGQAFETGVGTDAAPLPIVRVGVGEGGAGEDSFHLHTPTYDLPGGPFERAPGRDALSVAKSTVFVGPPPAPTNLTAVAEDGALLLSFGNSQADPRLAGYPVYVGGGKVATAPNSAPDGAGRVSYNLTGLTNGKLYTVGVSAIDTAGVESGVVYATAIPIAGGTGSVPAAPTGLAGVATVQGVNLTWIKTTDGRAATYEVVEVQAGTTISRLLGTVPATDAATYSVSGLMAGIAHTFAVQAQDAQGRTSALSTPLTIEPLPPEDGYMTAQNLTDLTDALASMYLTIKGDGTDRLETRATTFVQTVLDTEDEVVVTNLFNAAKSLRSTAPYLAYAKAQLATPVSSLAILASALGVTGVSDTDSLFAYYNTGLGGPWSALATPAFAELYTVITGGKLSPTNIYAAPNQTLATVVVGGSFTASAPLGSAAVAGAATVNAVAAGLTGSGILTVTGSARTAAGIIATGRTWSGVLTMSGTLLLTPTVAGDLALSVTSLSLATGITAGTIAIQTGLPTGRLSPTA